jgi:[histone H3]-lysine36 N-trimethyltransferase
VDDEDQTLSDISDNEESKKDNSVPTEPSSASLSPSLKRKWDGEEPTPGHDESEISPKKLKFDTPPPPTPPPPPGPPPEELPEESAEGDNIESNNLTPVEEYSIRSKYHELQQDTDKPSPVQLVTPPTTTNGSCDNDNEDMQANKGQQQQRRLQEGTGAEVHGR